MQSDHRGLGLRNTDGFIWSSIMFTNENVLLSVMKLKAFGYWFNGQISCSAIAKFLNCELGRRTPFKYLGLPIEQMQGGTW